MNSERNLDEDIMKDIELGCDYHSSSINIVGNLNVIHWNVRSLKNKLDDLHNFLVSTSITWDVICIAETWLQSGIVEYYNLDHYNMVASCRNNGEGGGVAIYLHEKYVICERKDLESKVCETSFVEFNVQANTKIHNIIVGEIYKPPSLSSRIFFEYLESLVDKLENEKKTVILAGDFNYNLLANAKADCSFFKNLMESYGFYQTIWKATRKQHQCDSLLDNILINIPSMIKSSGIIIDDLSDHLPIFTSMIIGMQLPQKRKQITVFNRSKMPELIDFLQGKLQHFQNNTDANVACKQLTGAYEEGIKLFSKTFTPSRRQTAIKPWITPGLLCSINMKNKMYRKFLRSSSTENENKYKQYRNVLVHLIRDAKKMYIQKALHESKNDSKETWTVISNLLNKVKTRQSKYPSAFYDNEGHRVVGEEVAEGFNTFFSTIGVQLENKIPATNKCPLDYMLNPTYDYTDNIPCTTSLQVRNIIKSLNPVGGGIDRINTVILQGTYEHLLPHLTRALLGLWISHRLLGGRLNAPPPMISAPGRRREKRKAAFESSRKIISKSFRSFFRSGQNWGLQGSKFQNFPKRFFDNKIFNLKDRATNLIPSCLSR